MSRLTVRRLVLTTGLVVVAAAGASPPTDVRAAGGGGYWIVLSSDRDGETRAYSVRPDGRRLTPLLPRGRHLEPVAISGDGHTIAYVDGEGIAVSRASGTAVHRLVAKGNHPSLSRDGMLVAYTSGDPEVLAVIGTNGRGLRTLRTERAGESLFDVPGWAPDGKALVAVRSNSSRSELVIQPLRGNERVLVRGSARSGPTSAKWSPDGRWIAYDDGTGLWVIRPDGTGRRRLARGEDVYPNTWSPDGKSLAYPSRQLSGVTIVGVDRNVSKRLQLGGHRRLSVDGLSWSPDGRQLAFQSGLIGPTQLWVVGADGSGLRRIASGGSNDLVGWTKLAPGRAAAGPLLPSERILDSQTLETRRPVVALAADGSRVAAVVGRTSADCDHIVIWAPWSRVLDRFRRPTPCKEGGHDIGPSIYAVALAGSRAAWASYFGCGNFCDYSVTTATLAKRMPVELTAFSVNSPQDVDFHLHGAGNVLVFNRGSLLVRIGPAGGTRLVQAGAIYSVSPRLIATRDVDTVAVLDARGKLVRRFPFAAGEVRAALLDGGHLVVMRAGVQEVYDVSTGRELLQQPLPGGFQLADVDGGIALLQRTDAIELMRLADGRSITLKPGRAPIHADLAKSGLYYSFATVDGGRIVFVSRSELVRRLG
jgi:Tol biopolymer transport system component